MWLTNKHNSQGRTFILALVVALVPWLGLLGCSSPKNTIPPESESSNSGVTPADRVASSGQPEALAKSWKEQLARIQADETPTFQTGLEANRVLLEQLTTVNEQLMDLLLDGGGVQDADLELLAELPALFHLRIRLSELTDSGVSRLAKADSKLEILNLPKAKITVVGIRRLAELPKLRQLRIGGEQIDDSAAAALAELPNLESLHLIGPGITAAGLKHLESSAELSSLYIDDCKLPDEAWESMFKAKPQLHVHIDQHHHDRDPNPDKH